MCGFAGFLDSSASVSNDNLRTLAERMAEPIRHRGPDDSGVWVDERVGLALSFRRLSIVDLSPEGHQPMSSSCGRYVVVFNGEIYNYAAMREELEKQGLASSFRGHSDTEVLLAAIAAWGLHGALARFIGMFSFALWDRHERQLSLVRDRLGIKPLYYGWFGGVFLFGSELKALRAHPHFNADIDRNSLALMVRLSYVPSPYSIYRQTSKLPPGTVLTLSETRGERPAPVPFWSARSVVEAGRAASFSGSEDEAVEELDSLLRDAVRLRMVADVPLGAFLSGGIDSSTVVALMQAQSDRPVRTFSIGFHESGYNEAHHARAIAQHLGTQHTELYVSSAEAIDVIPRLPHLYDEPFADPSQIPTYLVSHLARQHVTVSLSGDGGDELFSGYNRYFWARSLWSKMRWAPAALRSAVARVLRRMASRRWQGGFDTLQQVLPSRLRLPMLPDKLTKVADLLTIRSPEALYLSLVSSWKNPEDVVIGSHELATPLTDPSQWADVENLTERMMYLDTVTYLPEDILTKVDRASMGVSLEVRVPLLDHRVVEFAWKVPLSMKLRGDQGKYLLRKVLHRYVPQELMERPKMGFGVPIDTWLRGPLRDWAEDLLDERRLKDEGYINPMPVRQLWQKHLSGEGNYQYHLWTILMFQTWLEHQNVR